MEFSSIKQESVDDDDEKFSPAKADYFFEVSWEACNKVGGIYTVLRSKIGPMIERYGKNYFLVGPFFPNKLAGEFEEKALPGELKSIFATLEEEGIKCYYGAWLAKGEPNCILIDYSGYTSNNNGIKKSLWENFKVDSLGSDYHDFDEPVIWSTAAGRLIEEFKKSQKDKQVVAQFHEWLSGAGLLHLKQKKSPVGAVFTTHATTLGRAMCSAQINIYEIWDKIDPLMEAQKFNAHPKHLMEVACANNAEVFTTVSEITGIEAEHLLKKKPDLLLPNGLDLSSSPTFEEIAVKHKLYRERIREFLLYYFLPYQSFDVEDTLFYYICSRYEFHAKGMDIYIKALSRLNERLKEEGSKKTIVAFFWVPASVRGISQELVENKAYFEDIKDSVEDNEREIKNKLLSLLVSREEITEKNLFSEEFLYGNKKRVLRLMRSGLPRISTHDFYDENSDPIIKAFRQAGLDNKEEDRVKVIFYPIYLTGADGLLDLSYYEGILGSHLGIFPSYYEPWGYTPLEAAMLGVPTITTDLAGFGRHIEKNCPLSNKGIFVLKRMGKTEEESIEELTNIMHEYSNCSKNDRARHKMESKRKAHLADWKILANNYIIAHNLALERALQRAGQ
jgi:glycogen(starch) synthase